MINKVTLLGYVGNEPNIHSTESTKVANISLATTETFNQNGERKTTTEWHSVTFFGKLAEAVEQYVKKGSLIYIDGKIRTTSTEKNGEKKYYTGIVASSLKMIPSKSNDESENQPTDDLPF